MSTTPTLDELTAKFLGEQNALQSVDIDNTVDDQILGLLRNTKRRWAESVRKQQKKASIQKEPLPKSPKQKPAAKAKSSPKKQVAAAKLKEPQPQAQVKKQKPEPATPCSSQPSTLSTSPSTSEKAEPKPQTPKPSGPVKRKAPANGIICAKLPSKRIPKLSASTSALSNATDTLLDIAGKSLSTPLPKIPRKSFSSPGSTLSKDSKNLGFISARSHYQRMDEKSKLKSLKDAKQQRRDSRGSESKRRKSRDLVEYVDPWEKPMPFLTSSKEKDASYSACSCFQGGEKNNNYFQPFICTQDLIDVGMTILKVGRDSLHIDLKFCEDAYCDKEYLQRRIRDITSIDDYISKGTAFENIAKVGKAVEFLLVYFWDTPDNDINTIKRLYHSLKCKNSVAVLEGLDKECEYVTYLLPYVDHESTPATMASRKLNFIGIAKDQPAFIYAISNKPPKPDTQSPAVSSTSVLPGELADLPESILEDQTLDWRCGLLTVEDLVAMSRVCSKSERVREYIDYFVDANPQADLQYCERSAILRCVKEPNLLSAESQRWLQMHEAPPAEYQVEPGIESVFLKFRPSFGYNRPRAFEAN